MRWSERLAALVPSFHEIPPSTRSDALARQPSLILVSLDREDDCSGFRLSRLCGSLAGDCSGHDGFTAECAGMARRCPRVCLAHVTLPGGKPRIGPFEPSAANGEHSRPLSCSPRCQRVVICLCRLYMRNGISPYSEILQPFTRDDLTKRCSERLPLFAPHLP